MHDPRAKKLTTGSLINGKYRLQDQIGAGGMGQVFKAEQLPLGRPVAVKVVHPHLVKDPSNHSGSDGGDAFQRRFFREASALSQLRHRNIVTVFDYGRIEGQDAYFMVLEFLDGMPLSSRIKNGQRMEETEVIDLLRQLGRGLREVHRNGMVHRDLKPANVFLAHEGDEVICKLLDFGLVKQVDGEKLAGDPDEITEAGALLGSPTYMAPEQIEGSKIDARTDIYSLGVVLFHCLAGRPPFEGSLTQVMVQHSHKPPPLLGERCPGVAFSPSLERLVLRCMAKGPESRYQSVDEMLADLQAIEAQFGLAPSMLSGTYPTAPSGSYPASPSAPPGPPSRPSGSQSLAQSPSQSGARSSTSLRPIEAAPQSTLSGADDPTRAEVPRAAGKGRPIALLAAAGAIVAVAVTLSMRSPDAPGAPTPAASAAPSATAPASALASPVLRLESQPPGADVYEGKRLLGVTPLEIQGGPGQAARSFTLLLDGHEPSTIEQEIRESTRMVVPLRAAPPARGSGRPARGTPKATATADTPPPPVIRMTR